MGTVPAIADVISDIKYEIFSVFTTWGEQNWPSVPDPKRRHTLPKEHTAKIECERARREDRLTWAHILVEEVAEACNAPTPELMIEELVQVGAMAIMWIDSIKRNELG